MRRGSVWSVKRTEGPDPDRETDLKGPRNLVSECDRTFSGRSLDSGRRRPFRRTSESEEKRRRVFGLPVPTTTLSTTTSVRLDPVFGLVQCGRRHTGTRVYVIVSAGTS